MSLVRRTTIPNNLFSELNKKADGTIATQEEVMEENLVALSRRIDEIYDDPENCMILCCRQKLENDYRYCFAAFSMKDPVDDLIEIGISVFDKTAPPIIIYSYKNVDDLIKKAAETSKDTEKE